MNERDLFLAAIEISDPTERAEFLKKACAESPELRTQVEKLLQAHDQTSQFLESPVDAGRSAIDQTILTDSSDPQNSLAQEQADSEEIFRQFLSPPTRPGWLGRLAHYEIETILGQGAFGIVAKAFDEKLHRVVAIKLMSPELATTSPPRKRFLREARTAAAVTHENIVAIYAVEEEPIPYLVMEYISGQTLQQRLDENGPLDVNDILRIGQQVAAGLAAAHSANLIHRDIKPSNILLDDGPNERVKISDFGLARTIDDASMTQSGTIAGTPMYMSPEQARGATLDHRSDLFSLGSVMYQMTSGRPPFRANNTIAVLKRLCDDDPRPITDIIPGTPAWLCGIIAQLMKKDREDRFQSAQEVAQLLATCQQELQRDGNVFSLADTLVTTSPIKKESRPGSTIHKGVITGILMTLLAVLFVLVFSPRLARWFDTPIPTLPAVEQVTGLQFDGKDDWIQISDVDWAYPQFTLEAFVTSAPQSDNGTIAFLGNGDSENRELMSLFDGPPAAPGKRISGASIKGKYPYENAYGPFKGNERQHRALVFDGRYLNYYINGIWQGQRRAEPHEGLQWNMKKLHIGCDGSGKQFFEGTIHQLRVSRVARYSDDFKVSSSLTGDDQTLALYQFDEGQGDVLTDSSGNGHDGKINGAKWLQVNATSNSPLVKSDGWHGWPTDAPAPAIAPFDAEQARKHQEAWAKYLGVPVEYENSIGMKFRLIPPGEFLMGSSQEEIEAALKMAGENEAWREWIYSEAPQHKVVLTQPVYVGVSEVTQAQYEQVMGTNPSHFSATGEGKDAVANLETGNHPVEMVSWNDVAEFCAKLSQQEELKPFYFRSGETIAPLDGTGYRLPTEAEWESACRAGTTTRFWSGDDDQDLIQTCWFGSNSGGRTHAAGELKANPFGLSDVYGNVWEWVQDSWDPAFYGKFEEDAAINPSTPFSAGSQRVIRGGDWYYNPSRCRSSSRGDDRPTTRRAHIGFRVVLVVDAVKASKPDYSLEYDGVTSYSVTPTLQIQENQPWTIEGWVTALGRPLQKNHAVFILNPRINLALTHGSESGSYWSGLSNPKADQSANRFHSSDQFATFNKETHLALVNDGKSVRFFVDGVLQQSVIEAELSNELGHLNIGPPNPKAHTGMAGFRGRLDEVRISQVARYQQKFQPERRFEPDEQTLALYHFDEGEGDVLNDSSGNGHHGQIVGASWVRADGSQIDPLSKQTEWHGWPADAPAPAIAPFDAEQARKHQEEWAKYLGVPVEYENSIGMKFRLIPPGEFLMGSTPEEIEAALKQFPDKPEEQLWIQSEGPQHRVVLTQPFYLGLTELTQSQYFQIMGRNPSAHSPTGVKKDLVADMDTGNLPVELITWGMATDFCQKLSEQEKLSSCYLRTDGNCELVEGTGYRMPTEAQWEFACRAGTITRFWSGENDSDLTAVEHTSDSSGQVTREVGTSKANPFGLFEMLGNVHEWIEDGAVLDAPHTSGPGVAVDPFHPFSGIEHRIFRGGNNFRRLHDCRAGARHCYSRHVGTAGIGVRIALTVEGVRSLIPRSPEASIKGWHGWPTDAPAPAIAPFDAEQASKHQDAWAKHLNVPVEFKNSIGMKFRLIPPGEFLMGSTPEEIEEHLLRHPMNPAQQEWAKSEAPQHKVILTKPFFMGVTEVTQAQYHDIMGEDPSYYSKKGKHSALVNGLLTGIFPVEGVSATNAEEYCVQLGKRENLPEGYRLPTEAEWEYACRAGTTTRFTKGDLDSDIDSEGWCTNNSSERTHRIAELAPNQFSLYDMHGNVCEWVLDNWEPDVYRNRSEQPVIDPLFQVMHSNRRIWRGGSSGSAPLYCRSSKRESNSPAKGYGNNGFRVVLTVDALKKALENEPQISSSLNYGLKFDGTVNGFSIPLPETDLTGNATLEAWITCPQSAREKNNHTVLEAIGPDLNNLSLFLNGRGYPTAYVYHNGAQAFQQIFPLVPTHLAAVIHENQIQLFVNGKLKASNEFPPKNTVINSLDFAPLHHWRNDPSPFFEGEIAEVRLSNVARYTEDFNPVKRHEPDEHTLLLYHCDEGQGNVLNDSSGNNRHGKVLNATWVQQKVNTYLQQSPANANPSPSKAE